ncbi:glycerophosphodiester phosphodiesterase [Cellulomonas cellasea]|uniref:Glycerophosphoryl diester phosphodiesterase n=1 Tax=Cellulomonas cellasea TaxID=43670 RepID=A0A7W4UJ09_9CELL|nr:glycerophosphodiester phosphodiesterase [Cellulomonas cellasea]MBB2925064.1 glycerophosphoryl diester phosphodiesterase [Cellulomonas cellasea]
MPAPDRPLAVAHRGDPVNHRENTVEAVLAAARQGADAIEVDVQLAADGTVVVVHDDTFARLWDDPRPVAAMTWPEIARLGDGDVRVPRLAELLEVADGAGVPLVLDQKHPVAALPALRVVREARADATAFCGSTDGLLEIRAADPGATVYLNDDSMTLPDVRLLAQLRPQLYNPWFRLLAPATVDAMAAFGIRTCCWTPNTDAELRLVLDLGVDAVMTDRVGRLVEILDERAGRAGDDAG